MGCAANLLSPQATLTIRTGANRAPAKARPCKGNHDHQVRRAAEIGMARYEGAYRALAKV